MIGKLKVLAKYFLQRSFRRKLKRENTVRLKQDELLSKKYRRDTQKLIVFLIGGADYYSGQENISGGLLSIHSIFEETIKCSDIHGSEVLLCTLKGENLYYSFSTFSSNNSVFRYEQLESYFPQVSELVVHIPEYLVTSFLRQAKCGELDWLTSKKAHLNILNQSIELMPSADTIGELALWGKVTQSTAHKRSASQYFRDLYNIPLHHFSTYVSPENYKFVQFEKKENLIVFSPDDANKNEAIIKKLACAYPSYDTMVISGMSYEKYKECVASAKFAFTFGEGMDAYFVETIFSGGICFAIYNDKFFTKDFRSLRYVYHNFEHMSENILADIRYLNDESKYSVYQKQQFDLCAKHYSYDVYSRNIRSFYLGDYTFS